MSALLPAPIAPVTAPVTAPHSARALLRAKGRTFWLAAKLLPAGLKDEVAVLYAFCRVVDDAVDEAENPAAAREAALCLARELEGEAPRPEVATFRELAVRRGLELRCARELLQGVTSDLGPVRVADDAGLLRYAYLVAGTVGAMMERLLGSTDPGARATAIELGIAMQLTNICRDVREDAVRDRVYLPASRLRAHGVDPDAVARGEVEGARLAPVVREVLALADRHYHAARAGYRFLPWRARAAVAVAARLYRQIGVNLGARQGADPLRGRVVVPTLQKLGLAALELLRLARGPSLAEPERRFLHAPPG